MSDPKYPLYHGSLVFDNQTGITVKAEPGADWTDGVPVSMKSFGTGANGPFEYDVPIAPVKNSAALQLSTSNGRLDLKIKKAWFNDGLTQGTSGSSPTIVPGPDCQKILVKGYVDANAIRINVSSAAFHLWLHDGASTAFSIASGANDSGITVHIVNNPDATASDFGFVAASTVHETEWPDYIEFWKDPE